VREGSNETYSAAVPDTLDLAERARLGVNAMTGIIVPEENFQPQQGVRYYRNPPVMSGEYGTFVVQVGNEMWGKHVEALLEMRLMSGSDQGADLDIKSIEGMVGQIEDDGLFYTEIKNIDGKQLVDAEGFADMVSSARVMLALMVQHQLDPGGQWLEWVGRLARGLQGVAVHADDYAYYPDGHMGGAISRPRSGWKALAEPLGASMHATNQWYEASCNVHFTYGGVVRALCLWYELSGDETSLELARKLVNFMLLPRMWEPEAEPKAIISHQHGHFEGHMHATLWGFWGLLEYARVASDERIKAIVRDGYEYMRSFGIARIGLFGEGCTVGDMTNLAIKLTETGVGDYWEDVDQYVRNHLTELQLLDIEPLARIAEQSGEQEVMGWEDAERVLERTIGSICDDATHPTVATPGTMLCCAYNGLIAYYHAWRTTVQHTGGGAQVNLLLNRASPWLDVDSYLPHEGKVVIRNKSAHRLSVRLPRWANRAAMRVSLGERSVDAWWLGHYVVLNDLSPKDVVTIEFPMVESTETHAVGWEGVKMPGWTEWSLPARWEPPEAYTPFVCRFRGNTLVEIGPREEGLGYPLYLRDHMKAETARMRQVTRYVSPVVPVV
jgi:hypothetical protein